MAWVQVQAPTAVLGTATLNTSWSSTPVAGNLLLAIVRVNRNTSTATTCTTPSGWTAIPLFTAGSVANDVSNGTRHIGLFLFYRVADGNNTAGHDVAPSFTVNGTAGSSVNIEEWNGNSASPLDAEGVIQQLNATSGTITPAVAATIGDLIFTTITGVAANTPGITYGGGSSTDIAAASNSGNTYWGTGVQTAGSTGTISPTANVATITGTGLPIIAGVSVSFLAASGTPASVNPPAGLATGAETAPGIAAGANIAQVSGASTASEIVPGISTGVNLAIPAGNSTASETSPGISTGSNVSAVSGNTLASETAPIISAGANVLAVSGNASADETPPSLSLGVNVTTVAGLATAGVTPPSISAGSTVSANVNPGAANATAGLTSPSISAGASTVEVSGASVAGVTSPVITVTVNINIGAGNSQADITTPNISAGCVLVVPAGNCIASVTPPNTFILIELDLKYKIAKETWLTTVVGDKFTVKVSADRWETTVES